MKTITLSSLEEILATPRPLKPEYARLGIKDSYWASRKVSREDVREWEHSAAGIDSDR